MKIISDYPELKGQVFDSMDACATEEAKIDARRAEATKQAEQKKCARDAAVAAVDEARKKVREARIGLAEAQKKADENVRKVCEKNKALMQPAKEAYYSAERELRRVLSEYNKEYGPYRMQTNNSRELNIEELIDLIFGGL